MTNSADPGQLASSEANWSRSTLFAWFAYPSSAGPELKWFYSIETATLILIQLKITNEPVQDKTYNSSVLLAKSQISLYIHQVF